MWEGDVWVAVRAARAGAGVVRRGFDEEFTTEMKGVVDPVTEIDHEAESAITSVIASHFPNDSILAEEGGGADWRGRRVWIIDPLDGTVNFVNRIPQVAVSVALWDEGRPLVGVVIDVARDEEFVASEGEGARSNGRPIRCLEATSLQDSLLVTGFPYDRQEHARAYLRRHGASDDAITGHETHGGGRPRYGVGGLWPIRWLLGAWRPGGRQALGRGGRDAARHRGRWNGDGQQGIDQRAPAIRIRRHQREDPRGAAQIVEDSMPEHLL